MASVRETALTGLLDALKAINGPVVERDVIEPQAAPSEGLAILFDGDPGEPEISFSPIKYWYEHRANVTVVVQENTPAERTEKLDEILQDIATAVAQDRTLGGAVEDCRIVGIEDQDEILVDGAADMKAAEISILLMYETSDPLL